MGASAIQEQRDSEQSSTTSRTATDWRYSNLGYNQKHNARRRRSATQIALDPADFVAQWKVLVIDEGSKKIIDNVVKEDDILNENIANIESIEERREMNPDMDAIYILSPEPHIVDCLMADFERRRYRKAYLVWTALLHPQLRRRLDSGQAKAQTAGYETLSINYFPRESHLIDFRDPWSFPILYHPACNNLVAGHLEDLAQKADAIQITGICVSLGEYPKVRYYKTKTPIHEAHVLCSHLANFVQNKLDEYAHFNSNFPPPATRPQGVLIITDRSMDLVAPLIHEFTYQAMAYDLLSIKDADKVTYKTLVNEGRPDEQEKDVEIGEKDKIWVENRHRHMKDTIEKIMADFNKFLADNPHFTNSEGDATSLNAIKDMLAGLPQFQEAKELYSLHLSMAQKCMDIFAQHNLPDLAAVEQSLATGLDEDFKKPKNLADQVVRLLDDDNIGGSDRLRLIILYIMFREGVIQEDIQRLLAHSSLPPQDGEVITNMDLLGAHTTKALKDLKFHREPLFAKKTVPTAHSEEYVLSRFEPNLKLMLEDLAVGALDTKTFPYTRPELDNSEELALQSQASLRSAKPTWARNRMSTAENRQRVIVFMAGGATYSEARACYETSAAKGKDVFLTSSHMLSPAMFVRQVGDLSRDRRKLDLPIDRPKPQAPDYLFMKNDPPPRPPPNMAPPGIRPGQGVGLPSRAPMPPQKASGYDAGSYDRPAPKPPTAGLAAMSMNTNGGGPIPLNGNGADSKGKLEKKSKNKEEKEGKEKKKRGFFGTKKS
ncbi:Protein transport protein sec1 [Lachnellula suecica]|uniref:Protein transport protein sec1 n=1 Tax=Lachnellula suecica TaxID=602035 RepID=A0A8T9CGZ1_9HELO|nr:Protein transport protein sec1 [Lachnellula suecica]